MTDLSLVMPTVFLVFARVIPITVLSPALGAKMLTGRMRMVMGILITLCILPTVKLHESGCFFHALITQVFIGFFMAVISALPFYAVQAAGEWIDINRGETLSSLLIPQLNSRASSCGRLFLLLAAVIFFSTGYHLELVGEIIRSFHILNLDINLFELISMKTNIFLQEFLLERVSEFFMCIVRIGLPIVFVLWLADILLGIVNRMAPALQVFYLGIPLKLWIGALMIAIGGPFIVKEIENLFASLVNLVA
ncbi:flagellar biosynthetic protein FliR [bacterium]|nr:flagellar biosynthetic protein FliR [bacterium]